MDVEVLTGVSDIVAGGGAIAITAALAVIVLYMLRTIRNEVQEDGKVISSLISKHEEKTEKIHADYQAEIKAIHENYRIEIKELHDSYQLKIDKLNEAQHVRLKAINERAAKRYADYEERLKEQDRRHDEHRVEWASDFRDQHKLSVEMITSLVQSSHGVVNESLTLVKEVRDLLQ